MSSSVDSGTVESAKPEVERTWVGAPLLRDFAGLLLWTILGLSVFYIAVVGLVFGVNGLRTYVLVIPVTLVFVGLVDLFLVLPVFTARRIGAGPAGLAIVRFRGVDEYPWSGVKPGDRPPLTWPFVGRRYPVSLSGGPNVQLPGVGLTRAQAELVASHFGKTVEEIWPPQKLAKRRE
jgi:hypothetical protein